MGRPTVRIDLLTAATANYEKPDTLVSELTEKELSTSSGSSGDGKKREVYWERGKDLRDILIHLYEWHQLLLNWVYSNQNGDDKPFAPEFYNWETYGDVNTESWKKHQSISSEDIRTMFQQSYNEATKLMEALSNEELFSRGAYKRAGGSTPGSYFISAVANHYDWAMKKLKAHRKNYVKA